MKEYEKPKIEIIKVEDVDIITSSGDPNDIDTDSLGFQRCNMKLKQTILIMIMLAALALSIASARKNQKINNPNEENTQEEFQKVDENGVIYLPEEGIN